MEELVESFGRMIFRLIKWILIDAFVGFFLYGYGYVTLKIITFGQLPKPNQDNETLCEITGIISVVLTVSLIILLGPI